MENQNKVNPTLTNTVKNKVIETYAEDMAKVIEGNEGKVIKNMIHEQEMHELEKKNLSPKSRKNKIFIFVGLILLFIGFGLFILFGLLKKNLNTTEVQIQSNSIIFTDQNYFQEIGSMNKEAIAQSILNQTYNTDVEPGGVEGIHLTINKRPIGLREFIKNIEANLFLPSPQIVNDNFLIGIVNKNTKDLFILLKVKSFIDSFDSMRSWEGKMFNDLHGFFGINISVDTKELLSKDFVDGRIANKNTRILYDKNGKVVLMYVFADEHSVVIANSENAVNEVILRLAASQMSK